LVVLVIICAGVFLFIKKAKGNKRDQILQQYNQVMAAEKQRQQAMAGQPQPYGVNQGPMYPQQQYMQYQAPQGYQHPPQFNQNPTQANQYPPQLNQQSPQVNQQSPQVNQYPPQVNQHPQVNPTSENTTATPIEPAK
jgi:hypothetical protein